MLRKLLYIGIFATLAITLASCGPSKPIDYAAEAKLTQNYEGKDFISEGIGELTIKNLIDADTTHFESLSGLTAKVRYLAVDTPESTGKVEPWGKTATLFTNSKLEDATVIVGQDSKMYNHSTNFAPTAKDGNGRQLGFIWYATVENPTLDDFRLLNLEIVQEGFSNADGVSGFEYADLFTKADIQATNFKLHIHSTETDENFYYGASQPVSIQEALNNADDYVGTKIRVEGVISRKTGTYDAFMQSEELNEETQELESFGLFLFAGYRSIPPIRIEGNEIAVTGVFSEFGGSYQLSGIVYSQFYPDPVDDPKVLSTENVIDPIEMTSEEVATGDNLNLLVKLDAVTVTGGYGGLEEIDNSTGLNFANNAMTLYIDDVRGAAIRIPDDVAIYDEEGDPVKTYSYFADKVVNIIGVLTKYESQSGNVTYSVSLCNRNELTYAS